MQGLPIRTALFSVAFVVSLTLAACAGGGDSAGAEFNLVSADRLTVCTHAPYQPFEFQDDGGDFTGFDIELLRIIADNLGLELAVIVAPFDGIWLLPAAGECDVAGSAVTITEARARAALFSRPYFDAAQSLLVRTQNAVRFAGLADLAGRRIAVETGTTGELYARRNGPADATLVSFDIASEMFEALASGDVDAILQDLPVNGYRQTRDPAVTVTAIFPTGEQYGFAVDPANGGLAAAINAELAKLRANGIYDEMFKKWFG